MKLIRTEAATLAAFATLLFFNLLGDRLATDKIGLLPSGGLMVLLFAVMLWAAFSVVRHAECLAELLGEPYGTLILTLSVIGIEVALIASIMITGENKPTLARDTMFSIIMIVLNGLVGLTLVVGGLRHRLLAYNLQGANAFLTMLITFAVLGLVLPRFTLSAPGGELSPLMSFFLIAMSLALYAIFLTAQTMTLSEFFQEYHSTSDPDGAPFPSGEKQLRHGGEPKNVLFHAVALFAALLPVVLLSKQMAIYVDFGIEAIDAPLAFGGFLIAALILTPEGLSAIRAARENHLQRSVNLCLGSALSTMGLTIPVVLSVGWITDESVELGLEPTEIVLLAVTLVVSLVTFISKRTHVLQGAVHLALFATYIILIFDTPR